MFLVFNKEKIQTYIVSVLTVAVLITIANVGKIETIQTSSQEKELPIYNVQTDEKKVAFTMNCAWNADDIDKILETLQNNNVKITFFLVGEWVDKYPEAVKKIAEAGHEIGTHSNTHPHVNKLSSEKNLEEIKLSVNKIEKITNKKVELYRPPYGEYNDIVIRTAKNNGYYPIQWNLDTLDYKGLTGDEMWKRIEFVINNYGEKISTIQYLDGLIKNIKSQGFELVTVSELIYKDNYVIDNNGIQINTNT